MAKKIPLSSFIRVWMPFFRTHDLTISQRSWPLHFALWIHTPSTLNGSLNNTVLYQQMLIIWRSYYTDFLSSPELQHLINYILQYLKKSQLFISPPFLLVISLDTKVLSNSLFQTHGFNNSFTLNADHKNLSCFPRNDRITSHIYFVNKL